MNWTGGRLQQSKRTRRGGLTVEQEAYFSRAKARRSALGAALTARFEAESGCEFSGDERQRWRSRIAGGKEREGEREIEIERGRIGEEANETECENRSEYAGTGVEEDEVGGEDSDDGGSGNTTMAEDGREGVGEEGGRRGKGARMYGRREIDEADMSKRPLDLQRARRGLLQNPEWLNLGDRADLQRLRRARALERASAHRETSLKRTRQRKTAQRTTNARSRNSKNMAKQRHWDHESP